MFDRFDAWLGKTAFHPPIIWFCQVTRQTQYAASRLFWFVAMLMLFYRADGFWWQIITGIMCVIGMLTAGLMADAVTESWSIVRKIWIIQYVMDIAFFLIIIASGLEGKIETKGMLNMAIDVVVLFAEYAATIKTIPPRKTHEKKAAGRLARVKA